MCEQNSLAVSNNVKDALSLADVVERIEKQLEHLTQVHEELNREVKTLLRQEREQRDESKKALANFGSMILPYISKLKTACSDHERTAYLKLLETNIHEILSPFIISINSKHACLTPRETQVAVLVRDGKTSKEIADLLSVCPGAVDYHRSHIRRKLGLTNRKVNLQSALLSLMI